MEEFENCTEKLQVIFFKYCRFFSQQIRKNVFYQIMQAPIFHKNIISVLLNYFCEILRCSDLILHNICIDFFFFIEIIFQGFFSTKVSCHPHSSNLIRDDRLNSISTMFLIKFNTQWICAEIIIKIEIPWFNFFFLYTW